MTNVQTVAGLQLEKEAKWLWLKTEEYVYAGDSLHHQWQSKELIEGSSVKMSAHRSRSLMQNN